MKGKSKAGALAIIVAVGALAYYGIAHSKMNAQPGTGYLLNPTNYSFTTDPKGCEGFTFPAEVPAKTGSIDNAPKISIDKTANGTCSATYNATPADGNGPFTCLVTVNVQLGNLVITGATGNCKTSNGGAAVTLGSSS